MTPHCQISCFVLTLAVIFGHCQKLSVSFKENSDDETCSKEDIESGICQTQSKTQSSHTQKALKGG